MTIPAFTETNAVRKRLALDAARLMTGSPLYIDGGYHITD